eukprot:403356039
MSNNYQQQQYQDNPRINSARQQQQQQQNNASNVYQSASTTDIQNHNSNKKFSNKNSTSNLHASLDEQFQYGLNIITQSYEQKSKDFEIQLQDLNSQLGEKSDYIKRLEKRNGQLEKQVIDQQSQIQEQSLQLQHKDSVIKQLEQKCENLEKIRKDIINTVQLNSEIHNNNGSGSSRQQQQQISSRDIYQISPINNKSAIAAHNGYMRQNEEFNYQSKSANKQYPGYENQMLKQQQHSPQEAMRGVNTFKSIRPSNNLDFPLNRYSNNLPTQATQQHQQISTSITGSSASQMEGKIFFKNVKARLSEEDFNQFLLNIKRLNSKVQTKQQTLSKVQGLFGQDNEDLFRNFEHIICPSTGESNNTGSQHQQNYQSSSLFTGDYHLDN